MAASKTPNRTLSDGFLIPHLRPASDRIIHPLGEWWLDGPFPSIGCQGSKQGFLRRGVIWGTGYRRRKHRNRLLTLLRCLSKVNNDNEREKDSDWPTLEEGRNRRDLPGHASLHRGPEYDCGAAEVRGGGGKPDAGQGRADFRCPACASAFACYSPSLGELFRACLK